MDSALVAGKRMTLMGKKYQKGDPVPEAENLTLEKLRTLQNVGMLVPAPKPVVAKKASPKKEEASG